MDIIAKLLHTWCNSLDFPYTREMRNYLSWSRSKAISAKSEHSRCRRKSCRRPVFEASNFSRSRPARRFLRELQTKEQWTSELLTPKFAPVDGIKVGTLGSSLFSQKKSSVLMADEFLVLCARKFRQQTELRPINRYSVFYHFHSHSHTMSTQSAQRIDGTAIAKFASILSFFPSLKSFSRSIRENVSSRIQVLKSKYPRFQPQLVIIQAGERPDSSTYVWMKAKAAEEVGIKFRHIALPAEATGTPTAIIRLLESTGQPISAANEAVQATLSWHSNVTEIWVCPPANVRVMLCRGQWDEH